MAVASDLAPHTLDIHSIRWLSHLPRPNCWTSRCQLPWFEVGRIACCCSGCRLVYLSPSISPAPFSMVIFCETSERNWLLTLCHLTEITYSENSGESGVCKLWTFEEKAHWFPRRLRRQTTHSSPTLSYMPLKNPPYARACSDHSLLATDPDPYGRVLYSNLVAYPILSTYVITPKLRVLYKFYSSGYPGRLLSFFAFLLHVHLVGTCP